MQRSRCDRFPKEHFKHSAMGGYIFEADIRDVERRIAENKIQIDFE